MSFYSLYDTTDGTQPLEITDPKDLDKDELLQGIAHGSEAHLMEWLRRRDAVLAEKDLEASE
jgi:hypothetical protein